MSEESCYFITEKTIRCKNGREPFSSFCATHKLSFSDITNKDLLSTTAKCFRGLCYITKENKVGFHQDLAKIALLTNYINELIGRGYEYTEALDSVGCIIQNGGIFDDILAELGREPKWKGFEKILYAIHDLKREGVEVKFDDSIVGRRTGRPRQIDVSLRFKQGYYNYFVVIECKDHNKRISIEKLEAFRTKIEDVGAHKGVMVSQKGFQEGAVKVAESYNIDIFTLTEEKTDWIEKIKEEVLNVPFPEEIEFDHIALPSGILKAPFITSFENTIFYEDEKKSPLTLSRIVVDICDAMHKKRAHLPCVVKVKFAKTLFTMFPGTSFYTPVYGIKMNLKKFEFKSSKKVDIPPRISKYVYSDVLRQVSHVIPYEMAKEHMPH